LRKATSNWLPVGLCTSDHHCFRLNILSIFCPPYHALIQPVSYVFSCMNTMMTPCFAKSQDIQHCCGLTLDCGPMCTQLGITHSTFSTGWEEKIGWKSSWVETKTGRSLTSYHQRQNRLNLVKIYLIYSQLK